jgi:hypothetical protein
MALENKLEGATRDLLARAHKASRSLIYVIDDLLNLTKAEDGPVNSLEDTFDLSATGMLLNFCSRSSSLNIFIVSEVITAFRKEAMRKDLDLTVSTHQGSAYNRISYLVLPGSSNRRPCTPLHLSSKEGENPLYSHCYFPNQAIADYRAHYSSRNGEGRFFSAATSVVKPHE